MRCSLPVTLAIRGVYALLLGSGVSRASGVLTGWEITLDLISKVATLEKEEHIPNLENWYAQRFGEPPDYSKGISLNYS